jgi:hypothetical protein
MTTSIYALRELKRFLRGKSLKEVSLTLNPQVTSEIIKDSSLLRLIERQFRVKINLIPNSALHIEDIRIS